MTTATITVLEFPLSEVGFLALDRGIPDDACLQELCRRNMLVPMTSNFRIKDGRLKVLFPNTDLPKCAEAEDLYRQGIESIVDHRPADAVPFLRSLLKFNPYFIEARMALGRVLGELQKYAEALDECIEGLRLDPGNADLYSMAAVCLPEVPEMSPTIKLYASKAIELGTNDPMASYIMGSITLDEANFREALCYFDRVSELPGGRGMASYGRACVFGTMERYRRAALELEQFFAHADHVESDNEFVVTAREMYLTCCAFLEEQTKSKRLKLARRELARIEAEYGWNIEFREDASEETSDSRQLLWQSHDRPGIVIICGTRKMLRIQSLENRFSRSCGASVPT